MQASSDQANQPVAPGDDAGATRTGARRGRRATRTEVVIDDSAARRLAAGHVWVYRNQVARHQGEDGDIVRVVDGRGRPLGRAMYSARSTIALRLVTRDDREVDEALARARIAAARRRRPPPPGDHLPHAYRLVHGEADGLPAVVVDVYDRHLVVQTLTLAAERLLPIIESALVGELEPESILLRNDPAVRELEGLPREVRQLRGQTPDRVAIWEHGVHLRADLRHGNKTGLFLDQRENHRLARDLGGERVLDCFCYDGGFALHAAAGAREVLAVDISHDAIGRARVNAAENGFDNIEFVEANSFDVLRQLAADGRSFDLVILDPPAFAKNRASIEGALRGYKEINLRALKLLAPGGILITASCSYHLSAPRFAELLRDAAADARREVHVLARRGQAADHPVLLGVPETAYLKCWILRAGETLGQVRPRRSGR